MRHLRPLPLCKPHCVSGDQGSHQQGPLLLGKALFAAQGCFDLGWGAARKYGAGKEGVESGTLPRRPSSGRSRKVGQISIHSMPAGQV